MAEEYRGQRLSWVLTMAVMTLACGGSDPVAVAPSLQSASSPAGLASVEIPMPVQPLRLGSSPLKLLGVPVAVGPTSTLLLLDTGSSGLRVFAEAAPGVTRLGVPSRAEFGDGTVYEGELALAPVLVGPVMTEEPVVIQVVDWVGCVPEVPHCPGRDGARIFTEAGFAGVLGVALGARTASLDLYSPLTRLPQNLDTGFIIETGGFSAVLGTLTLGLTEQNRQGFLQAGVTQLGAGSTPPLRFPDGTPIWNDAQIQSLYTVLPPGGPPLLDQVPAQTLFDTGSSDISLEVLGPIPSSTILPSGSRFRVQFPALFDLTIGVGTPPTPSLDRIFIDTVPTDPLQIMGMPFFFRYDTLFDIEKGRFGVRAR